LYYDLNLLLAIFPYSFRFGANEAECIKSIHLLPSLPSLSHFIIFAVFIFWKLVMVQGESIEGDKSLPRVGARQRSESGGRRRVNYVCVCKEEYLCL
jgi:hypothetical protein